MAKMINKINFPNNLSDRKITFVKKDKTSKKKEGVVKTYTGLRKENLIRNNGKYAMYDKPLGMPIGLTTDVYHNEKGKPQQIHKGGLLGYTYDVNGEYGKGLNDSYGRDVENVKHYSINNVKPTFSVNDYDNHGDYMSYVNDVYGTRETYAGHLMGLMGVRDVLDDVAIDIFPNAEGKTFADTINEILQYTDIQYAMEGDKVGVIRNIDVAKALGGVITTNVNNYSGKDTRLGMISNQLYAKTLSRAAHFNSLRRTKYITPELDRLYGNNLSNVYSLSSLFLLADGQPRLIEPVSDSFVKEYVGETIDEYLINFIPEYNEMQQEIQEWNGRNRYFGFSKSVDSEEEISRRFNPNLVDEPKMVVSNMTEPSTVYRFYEEGDSSNDNAFKSFSSDISTLDGFKGETIAIKREGKDILNTTNKLFKNRLFDTLIGRFHTSNDKENTLTQSAVHPIFGLSKGRNLLTKSAWEDGESKDVNGYDNPYCRVWTYHNQYSKMTDLIRPFTDDGEFMGIDELQEKWKIFRNHKGHERLAKNSVLNKNGMVNITPTNDLEVDVKQCMFSIENLAWKDINISGKGGYRFDNGDFVRDYQNTLSEEQRGPNGGRIMWFPPYDIDFQETSSADWHEDVFIGRGEPIYTYTNTKRSGSLSFTLLIDHPSVLDYWMLDKKKGSNDINDEQTLLRYFAGCEPIAPSEDVINSMLRGDYDGGDKNITPILPGEDIVFNVYFPNNYSGVDEEGGAEGALEMLFGGQYINPDVVPFGTLKEFADSGETLFLGYEMGLNPISTAFYKFFVETNLVNKTLAEVMNKKKVDEKYKDQEFTEVANDKITKDKFLSEGHIYINYNRKEKNTSKEKLEGEKREYSTKKTELETLVNGMKTELKNMKEELSHLSSGTAEYELLTKDIEEKDREIFKNNYEINVYKSLIEGVDLALGLSVEDVQLCNEIFGEVNTKPFIKTQPIYCFYSKDNSGETISEKIEYNIDAKTAYAKYLLEKTNEYDNINDYYQKGLNDVVSRIKKGNKKDDGYDYYAAAISKKDGNVVYDAYNTFESKRDFSKSKWPFGRVEHKKGEETYYKYYYKNQKGNIKESDSKEEQVRTLVNDKILVTYPNEQAFKDSGAICGFLDDENKYVYYEAQKLNDKNAALQKISDSLTDGDVEKAYEVHMYGASKEIQTELDYWGIQYYCVYEKTISDEPNAETMGNYKTKQDFIVNEKVLMKKTFSDFMTFSNTQATYFNVYDNQGILIGRYAENKGNYDSGGLISYYEVLEESGTTRTYTLLDVNLDENMDVIAIKNEGGDMWYKDADYDGIIDKAFSTENDEYVDFVDTDNVITNQMLEIQKIIDEDGLMGKTISSAKYFGWGSGTIVIDDENKFDVTSRLIYYLNKEKKEYCYPHDNSTENQSLSAHNFVDLTSFGLNSTYEVAHEQDDSVTCSFGEFYAVTKDGNSGGTHTNFVLACEEAVLKARGVTGDTLVEKIEESKGRMQYIAECLEKYKDKITKVTVLGDASADGSAEGNDTLAKNRSKTLYDFLEGLEIGDVLTDETEGASDKQNSRGNVSDLNKKKDRKVQTKIILGFDDTPESERSETERTNSIHAQNFKEDQKQYRRYDDERLFFSMLREKDSFAYTNLVKKVQYFSPAFHSITPEGFNARLTFLQQCTRQGPTITASEVGTSGSTAANLAFGRAPFCVLRLGDFLNTRIVVRSVNITYPDNMWDLNHDGIGAQFMMAKVTMNIDIIGGSDISAPIKRLQNAVSFNYYANTSIYDNRSDIAQYNGNGTSSDVRTWNPSLKPRQNGVATQTNSSAEQTTTTETTQTNS